MYIMATVAPMTNKIEVKTFREDVSLAINNTLFARFFKGLTEKQWAQKITAPQRSLIHI